MLSVIALLIIFAINIIIFAPIEKTTYSATSSIKKVLETSEMYTAEYTYKSIAKALKNPGNPAEDSNIKYYVSYVGTVHYGFDTKKISIKETENKITIIIPEIKASSITIKNEFDYIFIKEKYETETILAETFEVCENDLKQKKKCSFWE